MREKTVLRIKSTDAEIPELRGLSGGPKSMWLRTHREQIIEYYDRHGEEATRRRYGIARIDVLEELIIRPKTVRFDNPLSTSRLDRYAILEEDIRSLKKEVVELKRQFSLFTDAVSTQFAQNFFKPLLAMSIKLDSDLESMQPGYNPLNISNLIKKELKEGKHGSRNTD